jgi:hypothetical protein
MEYMAAQMDKHIEAVSGQPVRAPLAKRLFDAGFTSRPRVLGAGGLPLGDE